ncbi:MAG: pyridoxamine 5'-phosphate oxidase [Actinobacteria bacterium]|nr:MAG: pyridoxamine 5'-phosphate oxidase [Actinomycetota bacterium]
MNWSEFAEAAPELAALCARRFEENRLGLVGTVRRDGSPRISPVEVFFVDGEPLLGMMWRSKKALDILRDPRVVVHSATSNPDGSEGDVKLYGRALEVRDPRLRQRYADVLEERIDWRPEEPFHLFSLDLDSAGYVAFGKEPVAMRWNRAEGFARIRHPND